MKEIDMQGAFELNPDFKFNTVRERDMDLLFLETIGSNINFANMIVNHTKWAGKQFEVKSVELSRIDAELGESDITVIIACEGITCAILIEDKIDAIAMPNQHGRYLARGKRGIANKEYNDFDVLMICPKKYYTNNDEAKLYDHHLFYEECAEYFRCNGDSSITNRIRSAQVQAALNKAKKPSSVNLNEAANSFLIQYIAYQKGKYPQLNLRSKENTNGWWGDYATNFGKSHIYHKMIDGFVDLTFPNASEQLDSVTIIAEWLRRHGMKNVIAVQTGKSASLRIEVPPLKVTKPFEETSEDDIKQCFDAIAALSEVADIFSFAHRLRNIEKHK